MKTYFISYSSFYVAVDDNEILSYDSIEQLRYVVDLSDTHEVADSVTFPGIHKEHILNSADFYFVIQNISLIQLKDGVAQNTHRYYPQIAYNKSYIKHILKCTLPEVLCLFCCSSFEITPIFDSYVDPSHASSTPNSDNAVSLSFTDITPWNGATLHDILVHVGRNMTTNEENFLGGRFNLKSIEHEFKSCLKLGIESMEYSQRKWYPELYDDLSSTLDKINSLQITTLPKEQHEWFIRRYNFC